ncbi:hypothetical protein Aca07nite_67980 [Actinoplanes capillaceus]|uniref:CsbD-like domain-containing protein n=1 Tax=Actinoplanes campanulatus TaxID=113559 RepID=A0ABQ3WTJ1_9ACTN|nr:CsbD family protein [Actinoplanes capillaceus]GID49523.1 hypothetical protein Aca07nite_67980 [Actinoplanes capillaceus]
MLGRGRGASWDSTTRSRTRRRKPPAKVEQNVGEATDDKVLQAEGKADQRSSNIKQAGEKIKDAFKK